MKFEDFYIIELCNYINPDTQKIQALMQEDLDYSYILGKLLINRTGALAYYTLSNNGLMEKLNREFKNALKNEYISCKDKTLEFFSMLGEIGALLQNAKFKYALLKGSYLSKLFPLGTRTSNDIDIFIDSSGIDAITNLLNKNNFSQGYIRQNKFVPASRLEILTAQLNRGETVPFIKPVAKKYYDYFEVDINLSFDYQAAKNNSGYSEMLNRIEPTIKTKTGSLYTFSKEDFIIHLCCHLYKEATTYPWISLDRDQGLYKYIDIYACVFKENALFVEAFVKRVHQLGFSKECHYAFAVLAKMYGGVFEKIRLLLANLSTTTLNTIYDPKTKKTYQYDMDLLDWIFCNSKKDYLYET